MNDADVAANRASLSIGVIGNNIDSGTTIYNDDSCARDNFSIISRTSCRLFHKKTRGINSRCSFTKSTSLSAITIKTREEIIKLKGMLQGPKLSTPSSSSNNRNKKLTKKNPSK